MKKNKIITSILTAALIITSLNIGTVVHAAEVGETSENEVHVEFVDDINSIQVKTSVDMDIENSKNGLENTISNDINLDFGKAYELPMTMAALDMETYYGTLTPENDLAYIVKVLEPGDILNTTLVCPLSEELDYNLMLCECDPDTGEVGDLLEVSRLATKFNTYPDNTEKTVDESISYINESNETKYYYIIIFSSQGYSTMYNFQLTISITEEGDYDIYEPNDSAYYPIDIAGTGTASGLSLHAENDNDWFRYTANSDITLNLSTNVTGYDVEVYMTDGSALYLVNTNDNGDYMVSSGKSYFIHVFSSMNNFVSLNYTLSINPGVVQPIVGTIYISAFDGDLGTDKATYSSGSLYRFKKEFTITALVTSTDGYAMANQAVVLAWESGGWSSSSGNDYREGYGTTNSSGKTTISITTPTSAASRYYVLNSATSFVHYYDLDRITVESGNVSKSMYVYHFAYSSYLNS